ncbi:MAG: hypothetical protein Q9182_000964 [Xanthomendoza sp. 2 TL-2023]
MNTAAQPTQKITKEPDEVDKRLERIRKDILPSDPYLMDLAVPYVLTLPPHLANNWRRSCPFDKNEEQLQYMTFLSHTERGDTMLRTTGDWEDGNGRLKSGSAKKASGSSSGAVSPLPGQPPRKKISLLDYKNKMAGQPSGKTSPKAINGEKTMTNKPLPANDIKPNPGVKSDEPAKSAPVKQNSEEKPKCEPTHGQKRSADKMAESRIAKAFDVPQVSPPSKKVQTKANMSQAAAALPDTVSVRVLPPMLSPTLPPVIEEQLAKLRGSKAKADEAAKKAEPNGSVAVKNKPKASESSTARDLKIKATPNDKDIETKKGRTNASLQQSASLLEPPITDSELRSKPVKVTAPTTAREVPPSISTAQKASKHLVDEPQENSKTHHPRKTDARDEKVDKKRKLLVLKIPKSLRKNCQRILQLQPRPKKAPTQTQVSGSSASQDRSRDRAIPNSNERQQVQKQRTIGIADSSVVNDAISKPKTAPNGLGAPKLGEKRRQPDGDKQSLQPPSKRPKPSGIDLSRPQTPVGSALRSPGILQSSGGHRSQLSTPKADRKGTAMDRIKSSEGDVKTPLGSIRSNTPVAPGSAERANNREVRSSSNVSTSSIATSVKKDDEASIFKAEFTKYADMAKSLKRAADALAKLPDGQINPDSVARRQGLAKAIETALCYMLAFTLKDEAARIKRMPGDRAVWVSLLPYFKFLKSLTLGKESPQLQGLFYQLEAVCRGTIERCDFENFERDASTDETFVKQMVENQRLAKQAWVDGTEILTHDHLREMYPESWAQRSKVLVSGAEREKLIPNQYGEGGFFLPLGSNSSAIEAVRAGWCFLEEWCKKEGVKWKGKMGL